MYDVGIIGGGPAAIFAAYEFVLKYPKIKIIMLEEGHDIRKRSCPIALKKVEQCISCNPCNSMRGFGGAGAFSARRARPGFEPDERQRLPAHRQKFYGRLCADGDKPGLHQLQ